MNNEDKIRRDDAIIAVCLSTTRDSATDAIKELPAAEPKGREENETLLAQMPTIKQAKSIERVVVYTDTYKQEYHKPKVGKWLDAGWDGEKCSLCGYSISDTYYSAQFNYCPNCGAKMERSE